MIWKKTVRHELVRALLPMHKITLMTASSRIGMTPVCATSTVRTNLMVTTAATLSGKTLMRAVMMVFMSPTLKRMPISTEKI